MWTRVNLLENRRIQLIFTVLAARVGWVGQLVFGGTHVGEDRCRTYSSVHPPVRRASIRTDRTRDPVGAKLGSFCFKQSAARAAAAPVPKHVTISHASERNLLFLFMATCVSMAKSIRE